MVNPELGRLCELVQEGAGAFKYVERLPAIGNGSGEVDIVHDQVLLSDSSSANFNYSSGNSFPNKLKLLSKLLLRIEFNTGEGATISFLKRLESHDQTLFSWAASDT